MTVVSNDIIPADWQHWSATEPTVIRPLTGGLTNRSFLIDADDKLLVLRNNSPISEALDLNRAAEADALHLADKAGLCAPVIHCDSDHQYLVTRYIEGEPWSEDGENALKQLAQLLRNIHALPPIDTHLDIETKIASYWRSIDASAEFYKELQEIDEKAQRHIAVADSLSDGICLCHNDLLPANLITANNRKLYAIDWEYAAMGDPFYELAVIVEERGLVKQQQKLLLSEYLGRPATQTDWQRLDHWRIIYGYLSLLWYAIQWNTGTGNDPGIRDTIVKKFHTLPGLN